MRRLSSLVAVAALLGLLLPAGAAAATRVTENIRYVSCGIQSDLGTVSLFADANSEFGGFAEIAYWEPGIDPAEAAPSLLGFGDTVATAGGLTATVEMFVESTGEPAGMATLEATLTPDGDPVDFAENGRQGNRWWRITGTSQPAIVAGSVTIDGVGDFDLAGGGCSGELVTMHVVGNNPAAQVATFSESFISCGWGDGETSMTYFTIFSDSFGGGAEYGSFTEDGGTFGWGEGLIGGGVFSASLEIFDGETEELVGTGAAEGTVTLERGRSRTVEDDGLSTQKIVSRTMAVDGTLTIEVDGVVEELALDSSACFAEARTVHYKYVGPKGPKGRVMPNDAPDGAVALTKLPARILTNTSLTSPEPEVPCLISDGEEEFELPIGSTAWWTFTGNGRDVTVNTARSSFDTALAIYTWDGTDFAEVACVDDVFDEATETFTLLAKATFATEAGETYYIQAGGFAGGTGRLQMTVR